MISFRKVVGMTEEQANQAIDHYHERFERVGWAENEVYAGIPSLLRSLKKNGARVAIVTAKPQVFAERIAEKFGLAPYLDDVIGPGLNNKDSSKAALVRRGAEAFGGRVVMVGYRCFDIEGGQANGVDTIGVCYGYGTEDELTAARATHIAHDVAELENILLGDAPRARGVFISMEGVDGCGKTTQRASLTDHLQKLGWRVTQTREPGGDAVAEKIRELVLDPMNKEMRNETGGLSVRGQPRAECPRGGSPGAPSRRRGGVRSVCRFLRGLSGRGAAAGHGGGRGAQRDGGRRNHAGYHRVPAHARRRGALPQAQRIRTGQARTAEGGFLRAAPVRRMSASLRGRKSA